MPRAERGVAFPQSSRSLFHVRTVEGPKLPLSRGLFGFVAMRCYAEECAFSLSTQAQDHAWDLVEYKQVEPAHCPTGATSGGTGCKRNTMRGIPPSFFFFLFFVSPQETVLSHKNFFCAHSSKRGLGKIECVRCERLHRGLVVFRS
jgi:hypothetical protein